MTSQLIPVQRPDKNGHIVTRWVRPDSTSLGKVSIPAVREVNSRTSTVATVKAKLLEAIRNGEYEETNLPDEDILFARMRVLNDDTLQAYLTAMNDEPR